MILFNLADFIQQGPKLPVGEIVTIGLLIGVSLTSHGIHIEYPVITKHDGMIISPPFSSFNLSRLLPF